MKGYSDELVQKLHAQVEVYTENNIEHTCKPVPDSDQHNVLDGRIRDVIQKKMITKKKSSEFSLFGTRHRSDKINYDISDGTVNETEVLVNIQKDHYIDVFIFEPNHLEHNLPISIYIHGGGFIAGDITLYRNEMKYLAQVSRTVIIFPEYRLAPENPYSAAVDDCLGVLNWVKKNHNKLGSKITDVIMIGDSAGGNIMNSCLVKNNYTGIQLMIEMYPVIDPDISTLEIKNGNFSVDKMDKEAVESRLKKMKNSKDAAYYLMDKLSSNDPLVNLSKIDDYSKIPSMTIISSQYDLLKIDSDNFIRKAQNNGKKIRSIRYLGCDHGFFDLIGIAPQAEEVCWEIADEIKKLKK